MEDQSVVVVEKDDRFYFSVDVGDKVVHISIIGDKFLTLDVSKSTLVEGDADSGIYFDELLGTMTHSFAKWAEIIRTEHGYPASIRDNGKDN